MGSRHQIIGGLHKILPVAAGVALGGPVGGLLAANSVAGLAAKSSGNQQSPEGGSLSAPMGAANPNLNWRPTITPEMMNQFSQPQIPQNLSKITPDMLQRLNQMPQFGKMANMQFMQRQKQMQMPPQSQMQQAMSGVPNSMYRI